MNARIDRNESQEDYLEAILRITQQKGYCRSVDVADLLMVAKPSVSTAMTKLRQKELIDMSEGKLIRLTEAGRRIAESVFERHNYFKRILLAAGVAEQTAEEEACALEHAISEDSFRKVLRRYQKSVQEA